MIVSTIWQNPHSPFCSPTAHFSCNLWSGNVTLLGFIEPSRERNDDWVCLNDMMLYVQCDNVCSFVQYAQNLVAVTFWVWCLWGRQNLLIDLGTPVCLCWLGRSCVHMGYYIPFSTVTRLKVYWEVCSLSVIYLPNQVECVLLSVI